jgi:hypothetical protein
MRSTPALPPAQTRSERRRTRRSLGVLVAAIVLAASARAQSSACDDYKGVLAARIESTGVRSYSLEVVPAGAAVPSDAKAIATCESGARKILYRRWGASKASSVAASAARAAPAAPRAAASAAEAASAPPVSAEAPVKAASGSAGESTAARLADRAVAQAVPANSGDPPIAQVPPARQAVAFVAGTWGWIAALLLLPVMRWVWRTYFSAYDKDGLPRGPRL